MSYGSFKNNVTDELFILKSYDIYVWTGLGTKWTARIYMPLNTTKPNIRAKKWYLKQFNCAQTNDLN